ncbi:MAG: hemolysin family protein [Phycisphaerae bacterium]
MGAILTELLILATLSIASGIFAMTEIAVVSARKVRLQSRADEGDKRAAEALKLLESPEQFFSVVQVGITVISVVAGAYGGASLTAKVATILPEWAWLTPYAGAVAFASVVLIITYLSLILGELIPKQIGLAHAESIASYAAAPVQLLVRMSSPLIWLLGGSSRAILAALRVRPQTDQGITEEEIKIVLDQGASAGVIERAEHNLVERVMDLADRSVAALMTPRTEITWIDVNEPIGENIRTMSAAAHTYFPVCDGAIENVLGIVSVKDLWTQLANKELPNLRAALNVVPYVPETMPALKLLETFKTSNRHLALVVDEYGGICGLVTMHNVLEAIVGDAAVEAGERNERAIRRPDGSWLLDGMLSDAEMEQILGIEELPGEASDYQTVAGFMLAQFGRIPRVADSLEWANYRFEVIDMDGHRIDKVLAVPLAAPEQSAGTKAAG